jgi:hypothetical protein
MQDLDSLAAFRRTISRKSKRRFKRAKKKRYKTFEATWRLAGGLIRVVLVDEPGGWVAFFCTDVNATVAEILATVADRFSLEITFRMEKGQEKDIAKYLC